MDGGENTFAEDCLIESTPLPLSQLKRISLFSQKYCIPVRAPVFSQDLTQTTV